ncbi:MAG TPA: molecular chaperone TorD family protein [Gaiellaceae bacterium]|nr:molecular chaperone TorD family protein [Gaiellaceae bacterium]
MLSYPYECPAAAARACAEAVRSESAEAASLLDAFGAVAEKTGLGELQEEYTRTFDLDSLSRAEPTCYLHVGHYLFEETHKRGAFILGLRRRFREAGFEDRSELADHLVVLLRFLAVCEDDGLAEELVEEALLPALARMGIVAVAGKPAGVRAAYLAVLRALELALAAGRPGRDPEAIETEREWLRGRDSLGIDRNLCGH